MVSSSGQEPLCQPAANLQVLILGPPQVFWCGHELHVRRRQVRALLYLLAMRLKPISREQLGFLLWSDVTEAQSRRNLSHLITHLRQALPSQDLLLVSDSTVSLNRELTYSDMVHLHSLRALAEDGADQIRVLQDIVSLYRGPLLAEFSLPGSPEFEVYVSQRQNALETLYLDALEELIADLRQSGKLDAAIEHARSYLNTHPLGEEIHRQLIEMYAEAGDRSAALNQYKQCAAMLEQDLGVPPLPETVDAYRRAILGKTVDVLSAHGKRWYIQPSLEVPMVGREQDMALLMREYELAREGRGRVVLVSGETGTGKSRLLYEFVSGLASRTLTLTATCHSGSRLIPFQPVTQALQALQDEQTISRIGTAELRTDILRLLPELNMLRTGLLEPCADEFDRTSARLYDVILRLAAEVCPNTCAVVLCFDDLQWADKSTLDWLTYLAAQLEGRALLVAGSYCCTATGAVIEMRHTLARLGVLTEVSMAGLQQDSVRRMVRHASLPGAPDPFLPARLTEATGGNPYYLLEMLRVLKENGQTPHEWIDHPNLRLPESILESARARIDRLSPMARQLLEAAAVLGMTFTFDQVRLTSGRQELEAMDALDELVARCFVSEAEDSFHFYHALMRRAVEQCMSPARLRLLKRRAERARDGRRRLS